MTGPLAGLRVLDIATIIAGPSTAALLGDYGASVVKAELPRTGDGARDFPPHKNGKPLWWKVTNRGKRLITLDLRKPDGVALMLRMLPKFDVLVENFRPGTLDKWGLTKEVLWAVQPSLVILRTTGFGQTGPYRNRPGFARVFEAMGGLTHITGEIDGAPMHAGYPVADNVGGLFGALGVLAALWRRAQDPQGPGEEIDLSLTEATLKLLEFLPIEYDQLGTVRQRSGNANQYSAPAAVYRTMDGHWVSLSGSTNAMFSNNCLAIGRSDLTGDPRFANNRMRVKHAVELNAIFSDWCAGQPLEEVLRAFETTHGTIAPIYGIDQIEADPHMGARKAICDVPDHDFGHVRMANVVPRFAGAPCEIRHTGGELGQDNLAFYGGELNLSVADIERLQSAGAI